MGLAMGPEQRKFRKEYWQDGMFYDFLFTGWEEEDLQCSQAKVNAKSAKSANSESLVPAQPALLKHPDAQWQLQASSAAGR